MGIHEAISVHNLLLGVFQSGCSFRISSKSGEAWKESKPWIRFLYYFEHVSKQARFTKKIFTTKKDSFWHSVMVLDYNDYRNRFIFFTTTLYL